MAKIQKQLPDSKKNARNGITVTFKDLVIQVRRTDSLPPKMREEFEVFQVGNVIYVKCHSDLAKAFYNAGMFSVDLKETPSKDKLLVNFQGGVENRPLGEIEVLDESTKEPLNSEVVVLYDRQKSDFHGIDTTEEFLVEWNSLFNELEKVKTEPATDNNKIEFEKNKIYHAAMTKVAKRMGQKEQTPA